MAIRAKHQEEANRQAWIIGGVLVLVMMAIVIPAIQEKMRSPAQRLIDAQLEQLEREIRQ